MEVFDATGLSERLRWEDNEYWLHLEAESPLEKYPAKQHARRVQEKLGVADGLIYLRGQPARNNEDSDMPAPFRQRRYFYYMTGCNEPDCFLTYDIRRDILTLFLPRIDPARVIYYGPGTTPAEALVKYDIDRAFFANEIEPFRESWTFGCGGRPSVIYVLHESSQLPGDLKPKARIDSKSLQPAMNTARMVKDDHEIEMIRKANDISSQAHREVLANILKFKNEAQVEGLFMDVCISHQAKQQAYDPIAASGPNAGTLHYSANDEDLAGRQLMCLDAGCEYELYASDITRTFPLSTSWPSKEAESIYKLVQSMQESCIERLAPGVRYLDLHILAHQIAIDGLLRLGILHNGTREEIYKAGTSRVFFPHGLGHHVGLEVHDVGQAELMSVRRGKLVYQQAPSSYPENFHIPVYDLETCHAPTDPQSSHLKEGMVVTVEPGIYFSVYALQHLYLPSPIHRKFINIAVLERYLPVGGVRIEDDILITSNGYENLTTAPKGDAMLEIIRRGKSRASNVPDQRPTLTRRRSNKIEPALIPAPGISGKGPQLGMRPLARAATMPTEFRRQADGDFEPFSGPSLFTNFTRSMTTEEKIQRWCKNRDAVPAPRTPPAPARKLPPVCGESRPNVHHFYLSNSSSLLSLSRQSPETESSSMCRNCLILVQTLDRLRQNLTASAKSPVEEKPTSESVPFSVGFKDARFKLAETKLKANKLRINESARASKSHDRPDRAVRFDPYVSSYAPLSEPAAQPSARYSPSQYQTSMPSQSPRVRPGHQQSTRDTTPTYIPNAAEDVLPTSEHHNPWGQPAFPPHVPTSDAEAERQGIEALRMRLESLEAGARMNVHCHAQAPTVQRSIPNLTCPAPRHSTSAQPSASCDNSRFSSAWGGPLFDAHQAEWRKKNEEQKEYLEREDSRRDLSFT
ncbi:hypothetical protein BDW02DRAFT_267161 [Decorospora gaudefroyi]|uniref:Xaa-Pro aminopeptidase n=1 Tax=Decorospora gaudefroyi TaxID=184978 RepID=A0A6A5KFJ8_9PLEO|nr:hypothetical protein BDW02DRAFT_267161 [Decorospora gaudefroyi]